MENKPRVYRSEILEKIMKEMDSQPWYIKLKRRIKVEFWIWRCLIFNRD